MLGGIQKYKILNLRNIRIPIAFGTPEDVMDRICVTRPREERAMLAEALRQNFLSPKDFCKFEEEQAREKKREMEERTRLYDASK